MNLEQIKTNVKALGIGNKLKNAQKTVERMQISILDGDIAVKNKVKQGIKEIEKAAENAAKARAKGVTLVSDYSKVADIYVEFLRDLNAEHLVHQFAARKTALKENIPAELHDTQFPIIDKYYEIQAGKSFQSIENMKAFLALKGFNFEVIQDAAKVAVKQAPKKAAKKEAAKA